ncbi:MAG: hypothetical protein ACK5EW_02960 [Bacteroidota bacterium]|jgi:hypothetical protein
MQMKKIIIAALFVASTSVISAQFKIVTVVESIIPGGMGRSRMVETTQDVDYNAFTTVRTGGKDSKMGDVDRGDIKIDAFRETKMLNFYSLVGINFQNIASNDAIMVSKLNEMDAQGYELMFVVSGVESDAGKISGKDVSGGDGEGIYITRYIFKKK